MNDLLDGISGFLTNAIRLRHANPIRPVRRFSTVTLPLFRPQVVSGLRLCYPSPTPRG
jgi:hypothetical protein